MKKKHIEVMQYKVRDDERVIEFEGKQLAGVSSWDNGKQRWIELTLYITVGGTYVLSGCGRSDVEGEVNRHWVQLSDEPEGIIDRLYLYNELGAKYIPHTSRALLIDASERDDALMRAYKVERVA